MRISDWSSDVCSSDLPRGEDEGDVAERLGEFDAVIGGVGFGQRRKFAALRPVERSPVDDDAADRIAMAVQELGRRMDDDVGAIVDRRSEEHTSELQSLMRISYAVSCLKKKKR